MATVNTIKKDPIKACAVLAAAFWQGMVRGRRIWSTAQRESSTGRTVGDWRQVGGAPEAVQAIAGDPELMDAWIKEAGMKEWKHSREDMKRGIVKSMYQQYMNVNVLFKL